MSLVAAFAAAAIATPAADAAEPRGAIRCRPAPYLVAEVDPPNRIERILVTGSRVPISVRDFPPPAKRQRPCMLMRDDGGPGGRYRVAD